MSQNPWYKKTPINGVRNFFGGSENRQGCFTAPRNYDRNGIRQKRNPLEFERYVWVRRPTKGRSVLHCRMTSDPRPAVCSDIRLLTRAGGTTARGHPHFLVWHPHLRDLTFYACHRPEEHRRLVIGRGLLLGRVGGCRLLRQPTERAGKKL